VRGIDIYRLAMSVNPGIFVSDHLPAALVQRPQLCGILSAGKVDLDASHIVAFELFF
jgi:hypothetical protein